MSVLAWLAGRACARAHGWSFEQASRRGRALGRLLYRLDSRHRSVALANLACAFPERPHSWRRRVARACFEQAGRTVTELMWGPRLRQEPEPERIVDIAGLELLQRALQQGRGALLASAHYGNWEITGLALALRGFPLVSVARPLDDPDLDRLLVALRCATGGRVLPKARALRGILRALREGSVVAILADQNTLRHEAVFVPFFGRPAATTPVLAHVHLRTGAPVLPAFPVPRDGGYTLVIEPPLRAPEGDRRARIVGLTAALTRRIEERVRERPEAWSWMHDRWRERPLAAAGTAAP